VPDNLRSGVTKACRYEPELNPTYADLARHYGVAVIPARVRKPRDKAKVEAGVLLVERWILACLRHQAFFSLAELNTTIATYLDRLNRRPFKKLPGCRQSVFETVDQPALQPLPLEPYVYAEWRTARVNIDSHLEVEGHYYSVPSPLVHRTLDVRLTATTVECFHKKPAGGQPCAERRAWPAHHRHRASPVGAPTVSGVVAVPADSVGGDHWARHRGRRRGALGAAAGIPNKATAPVWESSGSEREYGPARLEAACHRAQALEAFAYKSVQSILKTGLDQQPLPEPMPTVPLPIEHDHLRGTTYYQPHEGGV
jgi:hypothetical protein